jgi:hypothetical protein
MFICFSLLSVFSFVKDNSKYTKKIFFVIYFFVVFVSFLCIIFRADTMADYDGYVRSFILYENNPSQYRGISLERSFGDISNIVITVFHSNVFFLFLIYTLLGFSIKMVLFFKMSKYPIATLLIYFSFFIYLHDFIQIRVACAITYFVFSIYFRSINKNILCLLFLLVSFYFHFSAAIGFIILFLKNDKINIHLYIFALFFSYLVAIAGFNILDMLMYIPIAFVRSKASVYSRSPNYSLNDMFTIAKLVRLFFLLIIVINIKKIISEKKNILYIKLFFFSIIVQQIFITIPVFPTRLSEYLRISEIFILPQLADVFKEKRIYHLLLVLYCSYLFVFSITNYFEVF